MVDLIITHPAEGPAALFTRNFRVHAGIPIGLYVDGPRSPVALVYGDVSESVLAGIAEQYAGIIAIPSTDTGAVPEEPSHYESMTVKAPILAEMQHFERTDFTSFVRTFEGGTLVLKGMTGQALTLLFAADLVKATIRILSGEMERHTGSDRYGRPNPPPESIIYAPAVSLHFNLLKNAIQYLYRKLDLPLLTLPRWPASAPLAIFLSHDVDVVKKWTCKRSAYEIARGMKDLILFKPGPLTAAVRSISDSMRGRDPYWMFDELMFMESGSGFRSTWFFAPFGGSYNSRENAFDPVYHRKPSEITSMIRRLLENGFEIALHGTRRAHLDTKELERQIESFESRLGIRIGGVRHHYLMFKHEKTLDTAAAAGLLYDATLGFSGRPGFRNGMASPFFPYPSDHPAGSIIEIPLNFMDSCFIHGADSEQVMRQVTESYLYAKAAGGLFSVLIHPGNMDALEIPGLTKFYNSLLSRFRMDGARSMTGEEIALWWAARENVLKNIEYGPGMWRIKDVELPEEMDLYFTAPNIKNMRFSIEGAMGASSVNHDTLSIRPGSVDPKTGIIIIRKK